MRLPAVPRLYLGTMTFGWSQSSSNVDTAVATKMIQHFLLHDNSKTHHFVDTARIYAGGKTEKIIGEILPTLDAEKRESIKLGTKAHPSQPEGLSTKGISDQLNKSFEAMGIDSVCEMYLHQPDPNVSLLESLRCMDQLVKDGKVISVGMSNYHASEMERCFNLCDEYGLTKPSTYQGLYNPLNRAIEKELLPILRKHKCSFIAYNPLAAGLLSGKHFKPAEGDSVLEGRFKNNDNYLPRFYTPSNFEAVNIIRKACDEVGISMIEATYKWLLRHSPLSADDGVLLGASSMTQLEQNMAACSAAAQEDGTLDKSVLEAFERAWKITDEAGVFPYWRSYSSDMPDRENLDQGASYAAVKK